MCGIAGIFGNIDSRQLGAMNQRIAHRGPDDRDIWWDECNRIGLAHRRLAIIDLSSAGRQPLWDCDRRAVIVFNGEIFNYRELARDLRRDGFRLHSATDTEVILNLYLRDGERCIEQLNGMFAFAIWDTEKKQLLIARDGPGVKPLYYASTPQGFAFASELKALCCLSEVDRSIDYVALSHYITYLYCPAPRTPLIAVRKLEPGHAMIVRDGKVVRMWRHWHLPLASGKTSDDKSVAALESELEMLLARAVKRQMIADVPVGAFLSGGLDSSSLVVFARQYARERKLDCFTIGFKEGSEGAEGFPDDLPYARQVAEHLDVPLHVIWTGSEMASEFERMVYQLDEPQPDPAALNVLQIAKLAREHGTKVLLSGAGGDDIFGGYRRHRALMLERWWKWLPACLRSAGELGGGLFRADTAFGRRVAKLLQFAGRPDAERLAGYFTWLAPQLTVGLFVTDVRGMFEPPLQPLLRTLEQLPAEVSPLNRMLHLEQRYFLPDHNLNYTDKMAMAVGVEVRVPFLDPELMSFAAALPDHCKQNGAVGKWLFKRTMETHLPHRVIYRPKAGFGAPLRRWMRRELREHFETALAPDTIRQRGIFDPQAVQRLLQLDQEGRLDAAYPLFGLVCIETWCRQFLSARPSVTQTA